MELINESKLRIGNITSSGIYAILSEGKAKGTLGKPALTYIEECNMERKLGKSLDIESNARPLIWGKVLEQYAFNLLGLEYKLCSQETLIHPFIDYWSGSPDGEKYDEGKTVIDIKCPMTLKSFCQLVDPLYDFPELSGYEIMQKVIENHKSGEQYYWQLVSNAILTESKYAELIVCVPFKSDLESVREVVRNYDGNQNPLAWINYAEDNELPHIIDGGYYNSINVIRFEVPESDKQLLQNKVIELGKYLIKR